MSSGETTFDACSAQLMGSSVVSLACLLPTAAGRRRRGRRRAPTRRAPASAPEYPRPSSARHPQQRTDSCYVTHADTHRNSPIDLLAAVDVISYGRSPTPYLKEALAGGHLDGDRGGEADHGRAAQPCVRPAALLRALLAPDDAQRPAADGGPAGDAPLAGRRRCCVSSFDD